MKKLLMGNEAAAYGALACGVGVVTGYPGTPSTETLETAAKLAPEGVYVELSVNEKAALEVAAGASYSGLRTLVTMKQVGLNACADPVMSLSYIGVQGGMVIFVADDPGPISSQTEQDTRTFAQFSKLPCFDPSTPEEMYSMMADAYELSEKYNTPVIFRPTTRVCHATSIVDVSEPTEIRRSGHFEKDPRWCIFPKLSYEAHKRIEARNAELSIVLSDNKYNIIEGIGSVGVACGGIFYAYAKDAISSLGAEVKLFRCGIAHPFPEKLAYELLSSVERVLVLEELDPYIERQLLQLCGKYKLKTEICGKLNGYTPTAGEYDVAVCKDLLSEFIKAPIPKYIKYENIPALPVRPPVLCAGCPHRASFFAVKRAMKGRKAVFCGDIGCYTLGNSAPLHMVDTCLDMGADITIAQGIKRAEPDTKCFSFIGDSTFFHSGMTGVANAVYNKTDITIIILDNSTTAMTGHQPNPSVSPTLRGEAAESIDIAGVLTALGVKSVVTADPFDTEMAVEAVRSATEYEGVSAVIFKAPCAVKFRSGKTMSVSASCVGCSACVTWLGCPAIAMKNGTAVIDGNLCNGCGLCASVCPKSAIKYKE